MPQPLFLAADWGTTNLRVWVVGDDGAVLREERFPWGVGKLPKGEPARRLEDSVRPMLKAQELPAVACGMVGSTLGIVEVPYLDCPAGLSDLSRALHRAPGEGPGLHIAPGLRCRRPTGEPDVIRGEETKILGWAALDPERGRGRRLVCSPGTHSKWVLLENGRIERFVTCMSGELFDIISKNGVLKTEEGPADPDAFADGVRAGSQASALAATLFTARSKVVGGDMSQSAVRDYVSGILLGEETANLPRLLGAGDSTTIDIIGDPELRAVYAAACRLQGLPVEEHDAEEAVLKGLTVLYEQGVAA
ncbi:MAG TPA: 2-dehydro-3-deoxygalactonokinase [Caulobacteraceae bacterium]|jgi:2-dehydro-3-deoxygalactonokinase